MILEAYWQRLPDGAWVCLLTWRSAGDVMLRHGWIDRSRPARRAAP